MKVKGELSEGVGGVGHRSKANKADEGGGGRGSIRKSVQ